MAPLPSPSSNSSARVRSVRRSCATIRITSAFMSRNCGFLHSSASNTSALRISDLKPTHCFGEPTTMRTQPSAAGSTQYAPSALRFPSAGSNGLTGR